jgi:hypothetical protein
MYRENSLMENLMNSASQPSTTENDLIKQGLSAWEKPRCRDWDKASNGEEEITHVGYHIDTNDHEFSYVSSSAMRKRGLTFQHNVTFESQIRQQRQMTKELARKMRDGLDQATNSVLNASVNVLGANLRLMEHSLGPDDWGMNDILGRLNGTREALEDLREPLRLLLMALGEPKALGQE